MYKIKVDPHTHTIFSGHAFSTIGENAAEAARKGLSAIGMSDHFSPLFTPQRNGRPDYGYIMNMAALPARLNSVRIFSSVEIDIVDFDGHLAFWNLFPFGTREGESKSVADRLLETRDYSIASLHFFEGCRDGSVSQNTQMYCKALQNARIHILGHPARPGIPFDLDEVLLCAKEYGKIIEINDHSFDFGENITSVCEKMAIRCAELGVWISVGSDAHSSPYVGSFGRAQAMLEKIHFPQKLIVNESEDKFICIIRETGKKS